MAKRSTLVPILLVLGLAAPSPLLAETKGALQEKTVDVPRATQVPLDIAYEGSSLLSVESVNDPNEDDIENARKNDPKDATFLLMRFRYKNSDYVDHKVKLRVILLDAEGGVLGEAGRGGTLDKMKTGDTISFPMKVKTLDWPLAAKLKVTATFLK